MAAEWEADRQAFRHGTEVCCHDVDVTKMNHVECTYCGIQFSGVHFRQHRLQGVTKIDKDLTWVFRQFRVQRIYSKSERVDDLCP